MPLIIREANLAEIPETSRIYIESHQSDFPFLPEVHARRLDLDAEAEECCAWLASDPLNRVFVAMQDERMTGYIAVSRNRVDPIEYEGEIAGFFVRGVYRGQGVGLRLLRRAIEYLRQAGFARVLVYTLHLGQSIRFYQSLGGVPLNQVTQVFGAEPQQVDIFGWELLALQAEVDRRLIQLGLAESKSSQVQPAGG